VTISYSVRQMALVVKNFDATVDNVYRFTPVITEAMRARVCVCLFVCLCLSVSWD
jgi:hypothetical protein